MNGSPEGGSHVGLLDNWTVDVFYVSPTQRRFLPFNADMQIPLVGGAMVNYGEDSLLYVGGRHGQDADQRSTKMYRFLGKEMRVEVFRHAAWFSPQWPLPSQVD